MSRIRMWLAALVAVLAMVVVPALMFAQDTGKVVVKAVGDSLVVTGALIHLPGPLASLAGILIMVVAPALSTKLWDLFQKGNAWLDARGTIVKQVVAALLTWGLMQVLSLIHYVPGFTDVTQLTQNDIFQLASVGLTYIFKGHSNQADIKAQLNALPSETAAAAKAAAPPK